MSRPTLSRATLAAIGIVIAALVLRIAHVLTIRRYPLFDVLPLDSESYDHWAREIASGNWTRGRPFYQAPLYAYVLAALHTVTGGSLMAPRILNAFLGAGTVAVVIRLGWIEFGQSVGLLAGGLAAVHATFLFEESKVMKTPLGVFLAASTLLALVEARWRGSRAGYFGAGLLGAATALVRENALLFAVAVTVFLAWRTRGFRVPAWFAAGMVVGIAPATLHNFAYDHEWIPITSQMGQNFYTGSYAGNEGGGYLVPDFVRRSPRFEEIDFAREAEARAGRRLTPGEVSGFWMRAALRDLATEPMRFPRLFVHKLDLLFRDREIPDDEDIRFFRRYAPVLRAPLPGFGLFGVLGLVGLAWAALRRRVPGELVLFVVVYTISVACFFVFSRYRLPLVAPLAVFAAYAIRELIRAAHLRRGRELGVAAVAVVGLAMVVYRPLAGVESTANSYLSVGIAYEVQHRPDEAERAYREGLSMEPSHPKLLRRWARLRLQRAEPLDESERSDVQRALDSNPDETELRFRWATLLAQSGRLKSAARQFELILERGEEPPGVHANLAIAYRALGREAEAQEQASLAIAQDPNDEAMRAFLR